MIERRQVECGGDWALLFEREASCMSAHMAEDAEYEAEQRKQVGVDSLCDCVFLHAGLAKDRAIVPHHLYPPQ